MWTSQLEKEHNIRPGEEDQDVRRRALRTAGVPGEGLLLAVANSDEDAIDEFGHDEQQVFLPMSHKDIFPINRYAPSPCSRLLPPPPETWVIFVACARMYVMLGLPVLSSSDCNIVLGSENLSLACS